jgi:hypothetical protein
MALIQCVDVLPPAMQGGEPFVARSVGVGDVVDLAAEAVDLQHRLALRARQDPHGRVERAAGRGRFVIGSLGSGFERHAPAAVFEAG